MYTRRDVYATDRFINFEEINCKKRCRRVMGGCFFDAFRFCQNGMKYRVGLVDLNSAILIYNYKKTVPFR